MAVNYNFDVDIDTADRNQVLKHFDYVTASIHRGKTIKKHNSGVYLQGIPVDPLSGFSRIDYKDAEKQGWFKVDILNNTIYQYIRDQDHLKKLMHREPMWELLEHDDIINRLYHINGHSELVMQYKPTSTMELAMLLAIIRPAKKHLVGKSFDEIAESVWDKPADNSYYFKKSHSVAFAKVIEVQMNLLADGVTFT